jgi:hypothetical protein
VDPDDFMRPDLSRAARKSVGEEIGLLLEHAFRETLDAWHAERSLRVIVGLYLEDASTFAITPGTPGPDALRLLAGVALDLITYDAQGRPDFVEALDTYRRIVLIAAGDGDP